METQSGKQTVFDPKKIKVGWRVRKEDGDIDVLVESIQRIGQLQPVLVRLNQKGEPIIVAGLRRVRACRKLGINVNAVVIPDTDESTALILQLEENIKRKDFDKLEIGEGLKRLKQVYEKQHPEVKWGGHHGNMTDTGAENFVGDISKVLGVSKSYIYDLISIASLGEEDKDKISNENTVKKRNVEASKALSKIKKQKKLAKLEEVAENRAEKRKKEEPKENGSGFDVSVSCVLYDTDYKEIISIMKENGELFDLVLTDPPYGLERSTIAHNDRSCINDDGIVDWDKLDTVWISDVAQLLDEGGSIVAFTSLEMLGACKVMCEKSDLVYRGSMVWHKCISEDTRIPVVDDYGIHRFTPKELRRGDKVVSINKGITCLANVVGTENVGYRSNLIQITLEDGNSVVVTQDHKLPIVMNADNTLHLKEAMDITSNDSILVADKISIGTNLMQEGTYTEGRSVGTHLIAGMHSNKKDMLDIIRSSAVSYAFDLETNINMMLEPDVYFRGYEFIRGILDEVCDHLVAIREGGKEELELSISNKELLYDIYWLLKVAGVKGVIVTIDENTKCYVVKFNRSNMCSREGFSSVKVKSVKVVPGKCVWHVSVDSDSHLFAVDNGMFVLNSNPAPVHRAAYMPSCEALFWATKGDKYAFKPWVNAGTKEAHNYFEGPVCGGNERLDHPAQKPVWLMKKLLDRHTVSKCRIFDPFAGTGTTLVACAELELECVGCEIDEKFAKQARARLGAIK